ncbi:phage Gp37/Gp68 family protein [Sideroxydans lithotrophicus]|uniref:Gp37Gp68 family protein n=1 Tax=Sideroxydans lithotrophicus (strain ES-1) TaxID=580332 RepID=D5CTA2_SIDLE|nr:phage Gp37/Gp68 family protein [Sideroxydans lithotrophicus]ADE12188.1 Gp37Gp68 family protein [Sideroxydans lithotrophicus ES-1]
MADQRDGGIVWCNETWNPLRGCSRVSEGCRNCYAESMAARFCGAGMPYEGTINPETKRWSGTIKLVPEHLTDPLRWTRPRMIFVNSMSDLFHEDVPFQFIADVFAVMACTTRHTYQVLTKRPARMLEFFAWLNEELDGFGHPTRIDSLRVWPQWIPSKGNRGGYDNCGPLWPLENVWLGVTVENQEAADERIPLLLQTPAAVRWVSIEPLLEAVNIALWLDQLPATVDQRPRLDWCVVGGESGPNARPMHPDWARSLRDQCSAADVPFLFKQWGEWLPDWHGEYLEPLIVTQDRHHWDGLGKESYSFKVGKKRAGRMLDGVLHDGYPVVNP